MKRIHFFLIDLTIHSQNRRVHTWYIMLPFIAMSRNKPPARYFLFTWVLFCCYGVNDKDSCERNTNDIHIHDNNIAQLINQIILIRRSGPGWLSLTLMELNIWWRQGASRNRKGPANVQDVVHCSWCWLVRCDDWDVTEDGSWHSASGSHSCISVAVRLPATSQPPHKPLCPLPSPSSSHIPSGKLSSHHPVEFQQS